jgi:hypothetical protein
VGRDPEQFAMVSTQSVCGSSFEDWNNCRLNWLSRDFDVYTTR